MQGFTQDLSLTTQLQNSIIFTCYNTSINALASIQSKNAKGCNHENTFALLALNHPKRCDHL